MTEFQGLLLDLICVGFCGIAIIRHRYSRHSHPGVIYLIFHITVFTVRAWGIYNGATVFLNLSPGEATRGLFYADIFLVAATFGWLSVPERRSDPQKPPIRLHTDIIVRVAIFAMPFGLYEIAHNLYLPGSGTVDRTITTSYSMLGDTWPGLLLVALIYRAGFRWFLLWPFAAYLVAMGIQGESRFRVVLPLILALQIWMDRRGYRWPPIRVVVLLFIAALVFLPLKGIGESVRAGTFTTSSAVSTIEKSATEAFKGNNSEQALFDQYAISLTQSDRYGRPMYGSHYLSLLALPIPRTWWPGKPGIADHIKAISTPDRPLSTEGTIITVPGELYLDYRLPGLLFLGFFLARWSGIFFNRAYRSGFGSVFHFAYLLLASNLIQIYRDGLISVPVFVLVNDAPLMIIVVLHLMFRGGGNTENWMPHDEAKPVLAAPGRNT